MPRYPHGWERAGFPRDLFANLVDMIQINMSVAHNPNKLAWGKIRLLRKDQQ